MKVTKRELRRIIKESLMLEEGWLDDLGRKGLNAISKFIQPNTISGDMDLASAKEDLDRAVFQYAVSYAAGTEDPTDIQGGVQRAIKYIQSQPYKPGKK